MNKKLLGIILSAILVAIGVAPLPGPGTQSTYSASLDKELENIADRIVSDNIMSTLILRDECVKAFKTASREHAASVDAAFAAAGIQNENIKDAIVILREFVPRSREQ